MAEEKSPKLELRAGVPVTMTLTRESPLREGTNEYGTWHMWPVAVNGVKHVFFMPDPVHLAVAPRAQRNVSVTVLKADLGGKRIGYSVWVNGIQVLGEGGAAQPPVPLAAVQPPPAAPPPQYLPPAPAPVSVPAPAPVPMPPPGKPAEPEPESYGVADLSGQVTMLAQSLSHDMAACGKSVSNDMALDKAATLYSTLFIGAQRSGRRVYLRPPLAALQPIRDDSLANPPEPPDEIAPLATARVEAAGRIASALKCQFHHAVNLLAAHGGDNAGSKDELEAMANRAIAANPPKSQGVPRG